MGKTWNTRRRGDIADFNKWFTKGKEVWVINDHATNLAAQFEAQTCSRRVATGGGLFGGEGKALLQTYGEVYETRPFGLRNLASPEPGCGFRPGISGGLYGAEDATTFQHWDDPTYAQELDEKARKNRGRRR